MSFTIRSSFGGPNALGPLHDENDPVWQSALRLSLGLKVGAPKRDCLIATVPEGTLPQTDMAGESCRKYSFTPSQLAGMANTEAATTKVIDVESAVEMPELSVIQAAQPAEFPQRGSLYNRSAYDLDSFAP